MATTAPVNFDVNTLRQQVSATYDRAAVQSEIATRL